MKKFITFWVLALVSWMLSAADEPRYIGGDVSMLPMYEAHNQPYRDAYGKKIEKDMLLWFMEECSWNTFRVRLFVHPDKTDPSLCQDLEYVTAFGKRIKESGAYFLLDFHYSDEWVDAGHIQAPKAWKGASDAVMADSVGRYTREVLDALNAAGATPDLVQVGNEIMYGMCGIQVHPYADTNDNWPGFIGLLKAGCDAVREKCPNAQIIIHTDRPGNTSYNKYYYQKLIDGGVDYDIIGLSYYPFWHGYLTAEQVKNKSNKENLVRSIKQLAVDFPTKKVHIVEFAYNFQYWPDKGVNYDTRDAWPCSKAGQYNFVKDLVNALKEQENVKGLNYWFPEEAGNGDDTDWKTSKGSVLWTWQNRGFWNPENDNGHYINRTGQTSETVMPHMVCAPYYMAAFVKELPEGIETVSGERLVVSGKELRNGQVIIQRGEKEYTILGQEL